MDEARIVEESGAKGYGTQESKLKLSKVQSAGMAAAMAASALSGCGGSGNSGIKTVGILVAFLIMLVTEALPVVVTSLIFCGLMPVTGVTPDLGTALTGYSEPIVFFTLASFGIAAAMTTIPLAVVVVPLAWFLMVKVYMPAPVSRENIGRFIDSMDIPERMEKKEKKVLVIVCAMLLLWISSSWISMINVMIVATLGCCMMFLPGIEVLDVETFLRENSWDAFFLVGTVLSISAAMITNGVSDVIAGLVPALEISLPVLIELTAAIIFVSLLVIPVASSLVPILAPTLIAVAANAGVSPELIMMTAAVCACNCYLLPLDTVALITYGKGYYAMTDMAKSTLFLQIAVTVLAAVWLPVVGRVFM